MSILKNVKFEIKQIIKQFMQHIVLPLSYRLSRGQVDGNMVILADCHHDDCPFELRLIKNKLTDNGYEVVGYFFDMNNLSAVASFKKMIDFMKLYKKAGAVILCSYFLPAAACKKRKETLVINVWHGCGAMKKFGFDSEEDIPSNYKGNPFANTDIMCVSGRKCVAPFESAINNKDTQVIPMGISVTDIYYDEEYRNKCKEKFQRLYPEAEGKKVFLWAPTFRQNATYAQCVGEEDIDMLIEDAELTKNCFFVKSLHPNIYAGRKKTSPLKGYFGKNESDFMSTRELMVCSDVLITDYSSVWFEYLLLDKPIIYYVPDYDKYMSDRGLYLDFNEVPGLIIKENKDELKRAIINSEYNNERYDLKRRKFSDIYMGDCDGKATDKLLERINGKK